MYLSRRTEREILPLGVDEVCPWDVSGEKLLVLVARECSWCRKEPVLPGHLPEGAQGMLAPGLEHFPQEGLFEQKPEGQERQTKASASCSRVGEVAAGAFVDTLNPGIPALLFIPHLKGGCLLFSLQMVASRCSPSSSRFSWGPQPSERVNATGQAVPACTSLS